MAFKDSLRMLSAQFFTSDIGFVDNVAALSKMSRADLIRKGTVAYAKQLLTTYEDEHGIKIPVDELETFVIELLNSTTNAEKVAAKKKYKSVTPKAVLSTSEPMSVREHDDYEQEDEGQEGSYGPPTSCPVCAASYNELNEPELTTVRSGKDWGAWGCHVCNSNGRWYDTKESTILKNSCAETELPIARTVVK